MAAKIGLKYGSTEKIVKSEPPSALNVVCEQPSYNKPFLTILSSIGILHIAGPRHGV